MAGRRTLIDRGHEVVPQCGGIVERRSRDAGGGSRCDGREDVGAADVVQARNMGVGALTGVTVEDG